MKQIKLFIIFYLLSQVSFSQDNLSEKYNLMPWPQQIEVNNLNFKINQELSVAIIGDDLKKRVSNASVRFLRRLANRTGVFINKDFPIEDEVASIEIQFDSVSDLTINSVESYTLVVNKDKVYIKSSTDIGALRGLETLLQLVNFNNDGYYFEGVKIQDSPRFVWRGLMIDVARHFQPVNVIKRNLDAMASVKLNVFHWHLTDDQGFRVESKVYPKLQEFASDGLYYTHEQIKDVVSYASNLGIRVIPEFDVPGHASAILTAYPELGSKNGYNYSIERFAGVFDPTLNPTKVITYKFLENLFEEIVPLFPDEYFHIGGDENEGKHWDENEEIQKFKKKHNLETNHDLQTYFNIKLEKILKKFGKKLMGWDEIMTESMPTTAVIHSWRGENEGMSKGGSLIDAAKQGYQTVLSNGYYIDRMLSVEHHYSLDPIGEIQLNDEERKRILGGEATMWSELVTPLTIDSRIWPRTAAIAERFWSPKSINDVENMKTRLKDVSYKLEELGIMHLRNRDVILRNMTNNQNINSLITLSKICEPLKVYSRNKGGTEYKTYSPFTLFADACNVDAEDAISFNKSVKLLSEKNNSNLKSIKDKLLKWSNNHDLFLEISSNPNVKPLETLSFNLSKVSRKLLSAFNNKRLTSRELNKLKKTVELLKTPYVDVELVIVDSLQFLITHLENNYLRN